MLENKKIKILLTNDDGIYSQGIYALYRELKKIGDVTVVAPDSERSSISHAITLAHPIFVKTIKREGKFFGYGISGTPADCVKLALSVLLKQKPDLVVSGINLGPNEGCSVIYSGTVAGAREGALLGIPSIAASLATFTNPDFSYAAKFIVTLAKRIPKLRLPKGTFLNVNIPNKPKNQIKGARFTRQGLEPIHGIFTKKKDPHLRDYYWMSGKSPTKEKDVDVDTYALHNDYVTMTPIHCDTTDYKFLKNLSVRAW